MIRVFSLPIFCLVMFLCSNVNAQETDFSTLDLDADGKVSTTEFEEYVENKLPGFPFLELFSSRVDANGDKEISEAEFNDRMQHLEAIAEQAANGELDPETGGEKELSESEMAASEAYQNIGKLVDDGDWETISQRMTEEGRILFGRNTVRSALVISKMNIKTPVPMKVFDDTKAAITEVLQEYGLDKIAPQKRRNDEEGEEEEGEEEEEPADSKEPNELIDEALDKDGKRWEIIQAISEARAGSPFAGLLNNNVIGAEADGSDAVLLTITQKTGEEAPQVRISRPPNVVRMEKVDGNWLYAGMDAERSSEKAQEYLQRRRPQQRRRRPEESEF